MIGWRCSGRAKPIIADHPLVGRRSQHGRARLPPIPAARRSEGGQRAPPQRAAADCRGARAHRPRGLGVAGCVARSLARPCFPHAFGQGALRHRPCRRRRDAGGGAVRTQLRGLRVPDAVPRPRHAAVRRPPDRTRRDASSHVGRQLHGAPGRPRGCVVMTWSATSRPPIRCSWMMRSSTGASHSPYQVPSG